MMITFSFFCFLFCSMAFANLVVTLTAIMAQRPIPLSSRGDAFGEYQLNGSGTTLTVGDFSDDGAQFFSGGSHIAAFGAANANAHHGRGICQRAIKQSFTDGLFEDLAD